MDDKLIELVKNRALNSIKEIESRENKFYGQQLSIEDYKNLHYVENRDLSDYLNLLPGLDNSLNENTYVLDIGCGEGIALQQIQVKYHCNVAGTTISNTQIPNLIIHQCQADSLPFDCNCFDVVTSVHGISWEANQKKAINEIIRVLKPGGKAFIYLLPFSYSVELFVGNSFWKDLDREKYIRYYEFSSNSKFHGATMTCRRYDYPDNMVNGQCSEWFVLIQKKQSLF